MQFRSLKFLAKNVFLVELRDRHYALWGIEGNGPSLPKFYLN